ncbi:MAG: ABC transporter permease [Acidimicrobiales bacterium]
MTVVEAAASDAAGRNLGAVAEKPPRARRRWLPKFILALPSWFWYLSFFVVPLVLVTINSFGAKVKGSAGRVDLSNPSLDRYRDTLNGTYFDVLTKTLRISLIGTALCLLIGFPIAYWLAVRVPQRWRGVLLGLVIIPFWTNFLVRTLAWRIMLAPKGFLSNFLQSNSLRGSPIRVLDTASAVQIGVVYNYLPLMIFPVFVALDRLDPALREASKDLGANRIRTFFQVTLPLAAPGVVAGLLLVFIPLAGDYITAAVLGGAKGNMAGALVASQFLTAQNNALGSAVAVVLIISILLIIAASGIISISVRTILRRRRAVSLDPSPVAA